MAYDIGFIMAQNAGHVTNYRNLRRVAEDDPTLNSTWHEIYNYKEGGWVEKIRDRALPFVSTYYSGMARATWDMHRALRRQRYDALMCNVAEGVFFCHKFRRIPTLIDFDATPIQIDRMTAYGPAGDSTPMSMLKWRLKQRVFHSATLLHAWSNWAKQSVVDDYHIPADKIVVNPPGVNLQFWTPAPFARSGVKKRILFVGGDFRRKGGPLLLDWYQSQQPAEVELHIVTREPVASMPGVTVYHDMQPNSPQLLELYHKSDLFVLPSLAECFGIASVEAMGAGLPVIASNVGATAEIIESGRNGFIVPANDRAAFGAAISAILNDMPRRDEMGRQSRILAEQRFDLRNNARRTLDYLKQISTTQLSPQFADGQIASLEEG